MKVKGSFPVLVLTLAALNSTFFFLFYDFTNHIQEAQSFILTPTSIDSHRTSLMSSTNRHTVTSEIKATSAPSPGCLTFNNSLEELITSSKTIYITMNSKAGGTSMKKFVKECTGVDTTVYTPAIANFMTKQLHVPKIIAGHSVNHEAIIRILKNMSRKSILIYLHREETDRYLSAVKYVVGARVCGGYPPYDPKFVKQAKETTNGKCIVDELFMIQNIIEKKAGEIPDGTKTLGCELYETLHETGSKMIFMNYQNSNRLQKALATHHCPSMVESPVTVNKGRRDNVLIRMNDNSTVTLTEWIDAKGEALEWGYDSRRDQTCRRVTSKMEDSMYACPDQLYMNPDLLTL